MLAYHVVKQSKFPYNSSDELFVIGRLTTNLRYPFLLIATTFCTCRLMGGNNSCSQAASVGGNSVRSQLALAMEDPLHQVKLSGHLVELNVA